MFIEEGAGFTRESRFTFENLIATSLQMEPGLKNFYDSIMSLKGANVKEQLNKIGLSLKKKRQYWKSWKLWAVRQRWTAIQYQSQERSIYSIHTAPQ